jgi:tetratricopeptide (TPR) repeat protein
MELSSINHGTLVPKNGGRYNEISEKLNPLIESIMHFVTEGRRIADPAEQVEYAKYVSSRTNELMGKITLSSDLPKEELPKLTSHAKKLEGLFVRLQKENNPVQAQEVFAELEEIADFTAELAHKVAEDFGKPFITKEMYEIAANFSTAFIHLLAPKLLELSEGMDDLFKKLGPQAPLEAQIQAALLFNQHFDSILSSCNPQISERQLMMIIIKNIDLKFDLKSENNLRQKMKSITESLTQFARYLEMIERDRTPEKRIASFVDNLPIEYLQRRLPVFKERAEMTANLIGSLKRTKKNIQKRVYQMVEANSLVLRDDLDKFKALLQDAPPIPLSEPDEEILLGLEKNHQFFQKIVEAMEKRVAQAKAAAGKAGEITKASQEDIKRLLAADPKDLSLIATLHQRLKKAAHALEKAGCFQEAFDLRAAASKAIPINRDHPLMALDQKIAEGAAKNSNPVWGAYFSHLDSGSLKGGHVHMQRKEIDGRVKNLIDFKLTKAARAALSVDTIIHHFDEFERAGVKVSKKYLDQTYYIDVDGKFSSSELVRGRGYTLELDFEGLGTIRIGASPEDLCLYNIVNIEMDADLPDGEGLSKLNQITTLIGLGPLFLEQEPIAEERIKIATLTHTFYPALMAKLDQSELFFEASIEALKMRICHEEPGMKSVFQKYLVELPGLVRKEEVFPGKSVFVVTDLAEQLRAAGGWGVMAGVGTPGGNFEKVCAFIVRRLKEGTISSQDRFQAGWIREGNSSFDDLTLGGGDQVFTRMVTEQLKEAPIRLYPFHGQIQALYDLEALNRGGAYAFYEDMFGCKGMDYRTRDDLPTFTRYLREKHTDNEVMINNRIPPEFMCGVVVSTEQEKKILMDLLAAKEVVKEGKINGILVEDFVHVQDREKPFTKKMWGRP